MYITARFKGNENKQDIEALCAAVRSAGMDDFCFIRDVENWQKIFDDPIELWERSRQALVGCQALLIDISDAPSGGRVVEAGMAYALELPIFVIIKNDLSYKDVYRGIATEVILYETYNDIIPALKKYLQ